MIKELTFILGMSLPSFAQDASEKQEELSTRSYLETREQIEIKAPQIIHEIIEISQIHPEMVSYSSSKNKSLLEILAESLDLAASSLTLKCSDYYFNSPKLSVDVIIANANEEAPYAHFINFEFPDFAAYCNLLGQRAEK